MRAGLSLVPVADFSRQPMPYASALLRSRARRRIVYLPFGLIRLGGYSRTQAVAELFCRCPYHGFRWRSFAATSPTGSESRPRLSAHRRAPVSRLRIGVAGFRRGSGNPIGPVFPAISACSPSAETHHRSATVTSTVEWQIGGRGPRRYLLRGCVNTAIALVAGPLCSRFTGAVLFADFHSHLTGPALPRTPMKRVNRCWPERAASQAGAQSPRVRTAPLRHG